MNAPTANGALRIERVIGQPVHDMARLRAAQPRQGDMRREALAVGG